MDPDLVKQMNNVHARGTAVMATFAEQHGAMIIVAAQHDSRMMNGFLASQLFNLDLVQAKSAFHTPVEPSPSPLPAPPTK